MVVVLEEGGLWKPVKLGLGGGGHSLGTFQCFIVGIEGQNIRLVRRKYNKIKMN